MASVEFRFYEELNHFLPPKLRKRCFAYQGARDASVKHAIEALGVPHTEVELILADGASVGFEHRLRDGERISVYPTFEAFDIRPLLRVRADPLRDTRFIADAHLGRLAHYLRFLGYDTAWHGTGSDRELVAVALAERRIVLTRDRALLMHRDVTHGCYVRATQPLAQLRDLARRLQLDAGGERTSRCMLCNAQLEAVDKAIIAARLPPDTSLRHERFWRCAVCDRVYWRGSHWQRLRLMLLQALHCTAQS